jgi:VanZ family protein
MTSRRPAPAAHATAWNRIAGATWFWRATLGLLVVVVLYLALMPTPSATMTTGWDKLNHALAFGALSLSACFSGPRSGRSVFMVSVGLMAFGALIEVLQLQVPGREADLRDLMADGVGVMLGFGAALVLRLMLSLRSR